MVTYICRGNYCGSSMCISTWQVYYRSYILHSSYTWEKIGIQKAVHQLFTDIKKAYDSVNRELFYNGLIEFGISIKLARLIEMFLNETYNNVWVGNHLSDMFPIRNVLKQGDALSPMISNFPLEYTIRRVQVNQGGLKLNGQFIERCHPGRTYFVHHA
jgi:hypothetical protein